MYARVGGQHSRTRTRTAPAPHPRRTCAAYTPVSQARRVRHARLRARTAMTLHRNTIRNVHYMQPYNYCTRVYTHAQDTLAQAIAH